MMRIVGTLQEDVYTCVIMSSSVLVTLNVSEKVCSENDNTQFMFNTFKENRAFMG